MEPKMFAFFNLIAMLSLCHAFDSESVLMLQRLEQRVNQLESKQTEDGKHIELLRQKCDGSSGGVDLQKLETSLDGLRADVAALAANKERESQRMSDYHELRLELDSVHSDYGKLKVDLDGLKDRREEDLKVVSQQRNNQVTIKWLQKTSEDLRREIKELAAAHNVSAAIRQQQKSDNALSLLRSDVIDLRNKLEGVRVIQDRGAATVALMQQDVTDLQNQRHQTAANYQLFREEVSQLKDEFLLNLNSSAASRSVEVVGASSASLPLPLPLAMDEGESEEKVDDGATGATVQRAIKKKNKKFENNILESLFNVETNHRIRHRGHVQSEVEELRVVVTGLQMKQKRTDHKLNELRRNHTAVESHLQHIWGRMGDLLNVSRWRAAQHSSVERAIESLKDELNRVEENGVETTKTLHNLTDSVSGIDKLHSSTIQLFEALEGLEDEYSERIGDLHKEVSKFEFNMAQLSSSVNIMKEDQSNQYGALKTTRADMSGIRQQVEDQNYRLASLRSQLLHDEANSLLMNQQQGNGLSNHLEHGLGRNEDQTSLLLDLEARIAEFNARLIKQSRLVNDTVDGLRKKADLIHVVHWAESADRMDEKISNVSKLVDKTGNRVEKLERQMKDMFQQLPTDCSEVADSRTGSYQIHLPGAENSMSVLCDLESEGGGWTVIQNRAGSSVDFDRSWSDYKLGFGEVSFDGDFWIGNDALHRLSISGVQLRIELWDQDDAFRYAHYDNVRVEDEQHSYKLHVHGFEGNASDALSYHQGMKFSSRDEDHDYIDSINCAGQYGGGWWYRNCQHANLNGKYALGLTWFDQSTNTWLQLKRVQIKMRPRNYK